MLFLASFFSAQNALCACVFCSPFVDGAAPKDLSLNRDFELNLLMRIIYLLYLFGHFEMNYTLFEI